MSEPRNNTSTSTSTSTSTGDSTTATGGAMETVASADGTEIAFERTGSGPPLVLVHGGACDHRFWDHSDIRVTLAADHTVYAMDCRGVGRSGDHGAYDLEREFEDVAAVVDAVDGPATLLGHSSGALLSLEASRRTENLRQLVLYEPPIPVGEHEVVSDDVIAEMERLLAEGNDEEVLVFFLEEVAQSAPEEIDAQRSSPDWPDLVDAADVWTRNVRAVSEYEFDADRFASMTTPTVLLTGSESPALFRAATEAVADALPNAQILTFEDQAHEAMFTTPDRFIEEVRSVIGGAE